MIKGVNRQVLEVTNTENPYFERIIFFVKPEYNGESRDKLKAQAEIVSKAAVKPPKSRKSKKQLAYVTIQGLLCVGAGVALTFLLNLFG